MKVNATVSSPERSAVRQSSRSGSDDKVQQGERWVKGQRLEAWEALWEVVDAAVEVLYSKRVAEGEGVEGVVQRLSFLAPSTPSLFAVNGSLTAPSS